MEQLNELALFAGAGGGILGGKLLGWRTVCAVELDAYAASVLLQRQNDGCLPPFPVWDDIQTFDGKPWSGIVDVVSGGFPCQDISAAGKGAGITGEKSGLWKEFARIICEVRPQFVFVENSPRIVDRGMSTVLSDLASMGYDAEWGVLSAGEMGAIHKRERMWILAIVQTSNAMRRVRSLGRDFSGGWRQSESTTRHLAGAANREPWFLGGRDGVACLMDRLKAIGNGQVSYCMAEAFRKLIVRRVA